MGTAQKIKLRRQSAKMMMVLFPFVPNPSFSPKDLGLSEFRASFSFLTPSVFPVGGDGDFRVASLWHLLDNFCLTAMKESADNRAV